MMRGWMTGALSAVTRDCNSDSMLELVNWSELSTTSPSRGASCAYTRREYCAGMMTAPSILPVRTSSRACTSLVYSTVVNALTAPVIQPRLATQIALEIVELYPYVNYLKFLLPATIAMAMYISVMIGGGMLYIDDKARGVHEGYLVTPITKLELVFGMNIAGSMKAVLSGIVLMVVGSLMAGLDTIFHPLELLQLLCLILVTSIAFNGMMFLFMVRIDDPLVPRAMFGVLNVLLFYPSGAMYPIAAFPKWLRAMAVVDPFTYCIHGFKAILLKDGGFAAIRFDLFFLFVFGIGALLVATPLFKRTL